MNARAANSSTQDKATRLHDLGELLDRIKELSEQNDQLCLQDIVDVIGPRWFGPMLVVPGLVMVVPGVGDIPGVSLMMGCIVLLISAQVMLHREDVWLPAWLAERPVAADTVARGLKWVRSPARLLDKLTRRRLTWAVKHRWVYMIAATCILLAATTPLLEWIPFSAAIAGTSLTCFGLALLAQDGLLSLLAILFTVTVVGVLLSQLVF